MTKQFIKLNNVEFFAHHGVFDQETVVGNRFILNLRVELPSRESAIADDLAETISYADLYTLLKAEMAIPSKLLEHLAERILNRLIEDYPQLRSISLSVAKCNPPMGADIESAAIEMEWENDF